MEDLERAASLATSVAQAKLLDEAHAMIVALVRKLTHADHAFFLIEGEHGLKPVCDMGEEDPSPEVAKQVLEAGKRELARLKMKRKKADDAGERIPNDPTADTDELPCVAKARWIGKQDVGVIVIVRNDPIDVFSPKEREWLTKLANNASAGLALRYIEPTETAPPRTAEPRPKPEVARGSLAAVEALARDRFLGRSPKHLESLQRLARVGPTEEAILILGETGTGKEATANIAHELSPRRKGPFIVVDATVLKEGLVESQLFGHVKGAFTGADRDRKGLVEEAHGGTLFLDEFGELALDIQMKLLRFLQEGTYTRVGSNEVRRANCRIITATNAAIHTDKERFRRDVLFRIDCYRINLPPLRERMEDLELLADHFLLQAAANRRVPKTSPAALELLRSHDWPGNIRELRNVMRAAYVNAEGGPSIEREHVELSPTGPKNSWVDGDWRRKSNGLMARKALADNNGDMDAARKQLGVSRSTFYRYLGEEEPPRAVS